MGTRPCDFKVKNSTRALLAAMSAFKKAGLEIGRAEVTVTGKAVVLPRQTISPVNEKDAG